MVDSTRSENKPADEIRERLARLMDLLNKQSAFAGDNNDWGACCIKNYLDNHQHGVTLDHAFGLRSSKRGPKPMTEGAHDEWVVSAWLQVVEKTPVAREWPDTKTMASIGRYFGLGGRDPNHADDHGIASELKRILNRYHGSIVKQMVEKIDDQWNDCEG